MKVLAVLRHVALQIQQVAKIVVVGDRMRVKNVSYLGRYFRIYMDIHFTSIYLF